MTKGADFKQAIRTGNINEAFLVAMSNAPELNITTKIITADGHSTSIGPELDNYLRTQIDLVEGKVEHEIGEKLTGDRYSEIKQFHLQQVAKGYQTIQQNLLSLQKMFQLMSSFQQQASSHAGWVDIAADVTRDFPTEAELDRLYGEVSNALKAGASHQKTAIVREVDLTAENAEPQLPSFEADDEAIEDLLSLADLDRDELAEQPESDWSEWLDDEPDDQTKFDLESLDINDVAEDWQDWESELYSQSFKD